MNNREYLLKECIGWYRIEEIGTKIINSDETKSFIKLIEELPENYIKPIVFQAFCIDINKWMTDDSKLDKLTKGELTAKIKDLHKTTKSLKRQMKNLDIDVYLHDIYGDKVNEAISEFYFYKNINKTDRVHTPFEGRYLLLTELLNVVDFMGESLKQNYTKPMQRKAKPETYLARILLETFFELTNEPNYTPIAELVSLFSTKIERPEIRELLKTRVKELKKAYKADGYINQSNYFAITTRGELYRLLNEDNNILDLTDKYLKQKKGTHFKNRN